MNKTQHSQIIFILLLFSLLLFVGIIQWSNYLIKSGKICENFDSYTQIIHDNNLPDTSHTVNMPINTTFSCKNVCGPLARCYLSGEQCTSDVDCYGCQPLPQKEKVISSGVRGQNEAGKLTDGVTPTYSTLTTDIGTKALLYNDGENIQPVQYFNGIDMWRNQFNTGMELYDKRYAPSSNILPFLPKYPKRPTLSGQFIDDGPLASNAYL
jgi:hypothetical protein